MSTENSAQSSIDQGSAAGGVDNTKSQNVTEPNRKSGKQVASGSRQKFPKNDTRYWLPRIFKPVSGRGDESPHYSMKVAFKGQRMAFTLGTGNKDAAARKARDIYSELLSLGVNATLAKHRPQKAVPSERVATVGEWIEAAQKVFDGSPATFGAYARHLRSIAADILQVSKTKQRFASKNAKAYREQIDGVSLEIFTPEAVQGWRIRFVQRAENNPARLRISRISCNSILRQARALFSKKIVRFVSTVRAPDPLPFAEVEFYPRESMRYQSKIDPAELLRAAQSELAEKDAEAFKALLLALGVGLRRGEIDRLLWRQVDFTGKVIRIEVTEAGGLKSEDSTGSVPIDDTLAALLRAYRAKANGVFVIEGGEDGSAARTWGHRYRCEDVFTRLMSWLRKHGVEGTKPLHTLRKEAGSIIATKAGIYAASRFLRHSDIQVTSQHYADHKERVTVDLGALLSTPTESK